MRTSKQLYRLCQVNTLIHDNKSFSCREPIHEAQKLGIWVYDDFPIFYILPFCYRTWHSGSSCWAFLLALMEIGNSLDGPEEADMMVVQTGIERRSQERVSSTLLFFPFLHSIVKVNSWSRGAHPKGWELGLVVSNTHRRAVLPNKPSISQVSVTWPYFPTQW